MKLRQFALALGVVTVAVSLVGCATPRDYDIDVDALLQQLEMEAGMHQPVAAAPVLSAPAPAANIPAPAPVMAQPVAPSAEIPQGELTIQPDCLVQISVAEDPALNGSYPVNEIGAVKLGYVGPVILFNRTEAEAAEKITDILTSRHFRNATVQVRIIRASYDKVRVGGEVINSAQIKIGAGDSISLNDALLRAGGLKPTAKGAKVKVVRNGLRSIVPFASQGEVYSLFTPDGTPAVPEIELRNNDLAFVFVPVEEGGGGLSTGGGEKSVIVVGQLTQPGIYSFKDGQNCSMMHLLFRIGSQISPYANLKKVKVIRKSDRGWDEEFIVDADRLMEDGDPAADIPLQHGDRVIIPKRRISLF
ncbi:MAG: polysaccharide biosynthesis/export family protein [Lentisphaerae bacterium]|nr:polysaccharide biosynthesis/export family protein [Lentisphaerota bacterium]